jgi:lambda family phage portal protein
VTDRLRISWLDRLLIGIAPGWGQRRIQARARVSLMARHFEAAQGGRRTSGWQRYATDANVANQPALTSLRELARDLRRNNSWAKRGVEAVVNNTVGWGIVPKPANRSATRVDRALEIWNAWATSKACDYDGRLNFYGLQRLAMETIVESGEVLFLKEPAATIDGLAIPLRLRILEPDYIDTNRNGTKGEGGGPIYNGIEFDTAGRRVAYWLFPTHPGGNRLMTSQMVSVRVPADRVLHIYRVDRPGQIRGVPWLASAIARLKDFDDFEDAELMQQKVAACFGAFVTDIEGDGGGVGKQDATDPTLEHLEPGHIAYLPPGKQITFPTGIPTPRDGSFSVRSLRRVAVGLGIPYESLSGDYSQVNYSSARMARIEFKQNIHEWREHMLLPQLCDGVWAWAMAEAAAFEGWPSIPTAGWACQPMSILEPDKEALAYQRMIRAGLMTWAQAVAELGYDPIEQLDEIEQFNEDVDDRGIALDVDPRKMTAAGQQQQLPAGSADDASGDAKDSGDDAAEGADDTAH